MICSHRNLTAAFMVMALWTAPGDQDRATKRIYAPSSSPLQKGWRASGPKYPLPVEVLIIGDSLSFGPFGEELETLLRSYLGKDEVVLVASCGSSPEHWLSSFPTFVTTCGYRISSPVEVKQEDFQDNGKKPRPIRTPKIRMILSQYLPKTVFIQLGTNWMDHLPNNAGSEGDSARKLIADFVAEVRELAPSTRIIWILPPESSRYTVKTKDSVERWILRSATEQGFEATRSREMTGPYVAGKTGSDGVHYSKEAAKSWANMVFWSYYGLTD
jgi:hypothetical protein